MKFTIVVSHGRKGIRFIIENHKKEIVIGILVLMLFVAITVAAVYNYMHMQSTIGVEAA